jgi:hypothetical protein
MATVVAEVKAEGPRAVETLEMLTERAVKPVAVIAAERSMPEGTARRRTDRMAVRVRNRVAELMSAAAAGFAILLLLLHGPHENGGVGAGRGAPRATDPLPELPTVLTPQMLRDLAHEECHAKEFGLCLEYLDRARRIDPAGDREPGVVVDRKMAEGAAGERGDPKPRR